MSLYLSYIIVLVLRFYTRKDKLNYPLMDELSPEVSINQLGPVRTQHRQDPQLTLVAFHSVRKVLNIGCFNDKFILLFQLEMFRNKTYF